MDKNTRKLIDQFNKLLALKETKMAFDLEKKAIQSLNRIFKSYSNSLLKVLKEQGFFELIFSEASIFREEFLDDPNLDEKRFKELARKNGKTLVRNLLFDLFNDLNNNSKHTARVFKLLKDVYNLSGSRQVVSWVTQVRVMQNSKKVKGSREQELQEDLIIEDIRESLEVGTISANFFLKDERILTKLLERATNVNFVSDLDFERISNILVDEFYEKGDGPRSVATKIRRAFENISRARSILIARTESNVAQSQVRCLGFC